MGGRRQDSWNSATFSAKWTILHRSQRQNFNSRNFNVGIPQDSPLSEQMFNIYIHSLVKRLKKLKVSEVKYTQMIRVSKNKETWRKRSEWVSMDWRKGGKISNEKKEGVHICKNLKRLDKEYQVENLKHSYKTQVKVLRIWIDRKLNFKCHISQFPGQLKETNNLIKYICYRSQGPSTETAKSITKSIVLGKVDNNITIYGYTKLQI
jgi:hypothetical protein